MKRKCPDTQEKEKKPEASNMDMDVAAFLNQDFSDSEDDSQEAASEPATKKRKLSTSPEKGEDEKKMEEAEEGMDDEAPTNEMEQHQMDLAKLKELDPDFYEHLKEHASHLLDFEAPEKQDGEESDDNEEGDEEKKMKKKTVKSLIRMKEFTIADLKKLQNLGKKKPLEAFKKLVIVFKNTMDDETENEKKIFFPDNQTFDKFMKFIVVDGPKLVSGIIKKETNSDENKLVSNPKYFLKLQNLFKMYLKYLIRFMKKTSDDITSKLILSTIRYSIPIMMVLKFNINFVITVLVNQWVYGKRFIRQEAFTTILNMCEEMDPDKVLKLFLKQMYLMFTKSIKNAYNESAHRSIDYMISCMTEIYAINPTISFQHGFVCIRQLVIHINKCLKKQQSIKNPRKVDKNKKHRPPHLEVYNWRYFYCLKSFVKILCSTVKDKDDELHSLIYPLVEVILSLIRLHKSFIFFPLKLMCCEFLVEIVVECQVHVSVFPVLLEIIQWSGIRKKALRTTTPQINIEQTLKVKENVLYTEHCREVIFENICRLILMYSCAYSYCPGFPEFVHPICEILKKEIKDTKQGVLFLQSRLRKDVQDVIRKLQENSKWVKEKRVSIECTPEEMKNMDILKEFGNSPLDENLKNPTTYVKKVKFSDEENKKTQKNRKIETDTNESKQTEGKQSDAVVEKIENYPVSNKGDIVTELTFSDSEDEE